MSHAGPPPAAPHDSAADDSTEAESRLLAQFGEHLRLERSRSEATITAYTADLELLLAWARRREAAVEQIDLSVLRGWLAELHARGASASTLARRTSALRTFFGWTTATGRTP